MKEQQVVGWERGELGQQRPATKTQKYIFGWRRWGVGALKPALQRQQQRSPSWVLDIECKLTLEATANVRWPWSGKNGGVDKVPGNSRFEKGSNTQWLDYK